MTRTLKFEKDTLSQWFAVIPEWSGSRDDLQMVMGADTLLEIIAQGENNVEVLFSTEPFEGSNVLNWSEDDLVIGGGYYELPTYMNIEYNLNIWLCDVTKFVFGDMPRHIYFK